MTIARTRSREVRLKSRPEGAPCADNFALAAVTLDPPGRGQVQVRNRWMSVDPYMRGRMTTQKSYLPPFQIDAPLEGAAIGEVITSNYDGLKPGDLVQSMLGWREAFNAPGMVLQKIPGDGLPPEAYLGVLGLPGLTAYAGLLKVTGVKAGETVFVSAASGAVGSAACQIAKIKGATVIGSAGRADKCAFLREIGVDHVINYREQTDLTAAVANAAPEGIDVYFENVGGAHLEAALANAKTFARFALCGMISRYNAAEAHGPANIIQAGSKSLRLEGFIVSSYFHMMPAFIHEMSGWIKSGQIKWRQTVDEGIDQAPVALVKLFTGDNFGKMLVKLA